MAVAILPSAVKNLPLAYDAAEHYLQLFPAHFFVIVNEATADAFGVLVVLPALRTQTRTWYVPAAPGFQNHVEFAVHVVTEVHVLPAFTHHSY